MVGFILLGLILGVLVECILVSSIYEDQETYAGVSWTKGLDINCWNACGGGGLCTFWCGTNGFCCRMGFRDCPKEAQFASKDYHSCVLRLTGRIIDGSTIRMHWGFFFWACNMGRC